MGDEGLVGWLGWRREKGGGQVVRVGRYVGKGEDVGVCGSEDGSVRRINAWGQEGEIWKVRCALGGGLEAAAAGTAAGAAGTDEGG